MSLKGAMEKCCRWFFAIKKRKTIKIWSSKNGSGPQIRHPWLSYRDETIGDTFVYTILLMMHIIPDIFSQDLLAMDSGIDIRVPRGGGGNGVVGRGMQSLEYSTLLRNANNYSSEMDMRKRYKSLKKTVTLFSAVGEARTGRRCTVVWISLKPGCKYWAARRTVD